ncbi:hypothetical protein ACFLZ6_01095 [Nanoarchaeota archaeon]
MDIKNEVIENRGKIRINELKLQALIKILSKEGVVTKAEVKEELNELLEADKSEGK